MNGVMLGLITGSDTIWRNLGVPQHHISEVYGRQGVVTPLQVLLGRIIGIVIPF